MYRNIVFWFSIVTFLLCGAYAWGHATNHPQANDMTPDQFNWVKRQKSVDGRWCCGPENIYFVEDPHLRVRNGRYEVHLLGRWVSIPPGAMHRYNPDDPSPFPGEIMLFFSTEGENITIWCLTSPTGG